MEGTGEIDLDNVDMTFEEKDALWKIIYKKISEAIENSFPFIVLFSFDVTKETETGYSFIIKKSEYIHFLENFLQWAEVLERFETCIEIQSLINKVKLWQTETTNLD